jgi:membrane protein implicated in regulation of membrane protease activity
MHQYRKTRDEVSMAELQRDADRPLVACSLWLHVAFIGAAALAVGILQLFDGETTWLSALALAFSGAVLAAASWRRARTVLEGSQHAGRRMSSRISTGIEPRAR